MRSSLILQTTTRLLVTLMLIFSLFLLWRGHNLPGGGFIGALVAAAAFALHGMAFSVEQARQLLRIDPRTMIGIGLIFGVAAGFFGLAVGQPYMTGLWIEYGALKVGTPLIFDIGVYLVVIGTTLAVIFSLEEEK